MDLVFRVIAIRLIQVQRITKVAMRTPEHYLVVDFEATCCDDDSIALNEREVIEFGSVVVEAQNLSLVSEFAAFVRPTLHPTLSTFCLNLTGIRQADVDDACVFDAVLEKFIVWQAEFRDALFCSWGPFDFAQLNLECARLRLRNPFSEYLNLKEEFASSNQLPMPCGMKAALRMTSLPLLGSRHRGIDDARNVARLMPFIVGRRSICDRSL